MVFSKRISTRTSRNNTRSQKASSLTRRIGCLPRRYFCKHVTVNAENAMVADSITTGVPASGTQAGNLLTASAEKPMSTVGDPVRE